MQAGVHFESQSPDEEVVYVFRAHPITNIRWIIGGILFSFIPLIVAIILVFPGPYSLPIKNASILAVLLVWWLFVVGFMFREFLVWFFNLYIITNKRIVDIDYFSLFSKQVSETPLDNIQDITHREVGPLQHWLDFGDIFIQTAGAAHNFEFHNIPNPDGVQKDLMDLVRKSRRLHEHA